MRSAPSPSVRGKVGASVHLPPESRGRPPSPSSLIPHRVSAEPTTRHVPGLSAASDHAAKTFTDFFCTFVCEGRGRDPVRGFGEQTEGDVTPFVTL